MKEIIRINQLQMVISSDVRVIQELNFLYNIPQWDCPTCDLMVVSEKKKKQNKYKDKNISSIQVPVLQNHFTS